MPRLPSPGGIRALFAGRAFLFLFLSQAAALLAGFGGWLTSMLAVSELTGGSLSAISWTSALISAALLVGGFFGGPLVDRLDRRRLMVIAALLRGTMLGLAALAFHHRSVVLTVSCVALGSMGTGLAMSLRDAVLQQIVPREQLLAANALLMSSNSVALALGPSLAGLTIQFAGTAVGFLTLGAIHAVSAVFAAPIRIPPLVATTPTTGRGGSKRGPLREGLAFVAEEPTVRAALLLLLPVMITGGINAALTVPFAEQVLRIQPGQLGVSRTLLGVGIVLGGLVVATGRAKRLSPATILTFCMGLGGAATVAISQARSFLQYLLLQLPYGVVDVAAQSAGPTLVQLATPPQLVGRVMGNIRGLMRGGNLLGMLLAPALGHALGLRWSFAALGGVVMLAAAVGWLRLRRVGPATPPTDGPG